MRTPVSKAVLLAAVLVAGVSSTARAQSNSIPWHTIAGGGGASTNVTFVIRGTIGQTFVGRMTNASRALVGGFWSITATNITTNLPPSIITQPENLTLAAGYNATFTVLADGTPPLGYQWRFNGTNILGATNADYKRSNVQPADAGAYSVLVTNSTGSVTSSVAILSVTSSPPVIIAQTKNRTNSAGDKVSFFVIARGSEPLSYQWRFNGTNVPAETNFTYRINPIGPDNAGNYSVVVSNAEGSVTSLNTSFTVIGSFASTRSRWLFNSTTPDANTTTGGTLPAIGGGTLTVIGSSLTNGFQKGSSSDPEFLLMDNSGLQTSYYSPADPNKTAGVQCNQSTLGCSNIVVTWKQRSSTSASKYWRFQYTTDGSTYTDADVITMNVARVFRSSMWI